MLIGKIVSIQFDQFRVRIFSDVRGGTLSIHGEIYYFGNIGSYLKTQNALGEDIICEVIAIFDSDKQDIDKNFDFNSNKELLLKPIGTYKNAVFSLGIGVYPSLYSDVSLFAGQELRGILMSTNEKQIELGVGEIYLGVSKNLINHPIYIQAEKFFGIHSAVLGNSGSGKSNTIAHILQEVYKKEQPAFGTKIIIFDVNGEYGQAFSEIGDVKVRRFKPNIEKSEDGVEPFYMPHFLLSLDEWCAFLMAADAVQKPFWEKVLQEAYRFYKISTLALEADKTEYLNYLRYKLHSFASNILMQTEVDTSKITTLTSVIFKIKDIIKNTMLDNEQAKDLMQDADKIFEKCDLNFGKKNDAIMDVLDEIKTRVDFDRIEEIPKCKVSEEVFFDHTFLRMATEIILLDEETRGNKATRGYVGTMLTRLDYFVENPECSFMCGRDDEKIVSKDKYLEYLLGQESQLTIIDTSELGKDVLETLTSVVSRLIFEYRKKQIGTERQKNPVHLILDEAHRYIKKDQKYLLKDNVFERIAREGRKYSLYLLISSQRPSELSETVLSQCANFIIHRIQNENDMGHINAVLPYFSDDFVSKIKQSVAGEALVFGECVPMPMHIKIKKADPEPHSSNCKITQEWYKKQNKQHRF